MHIHIVTGNKSIELGFLLLHFAILIGQHIELGFVIPT